MPAVDKNPQIYEVFLPKMPILNIAICIQNTGLKKLKKFDRTKLKVYNRREAKREVG
jgi:hypothetical protein